LNIEKLPNARDCLIVERGVLLPGAHLQPPASELGPIEGADGSLGNFSVSVALYFFQALTFSFLPPSSAPSKALMAAWATSVSL